MFGSYANLKVPNKTDTMKQFTLAVLFILATMSLSAQNKKFPVVGYYAAWSGEPEDIAFDHLTQVNFSFAFPGSDGSVRIAETGKLMALVELAHEKNVKVFLAVGGWDIGDGGGNDQAFEVMAKNEKSRKRFVSSLLFHIKDYELDGIDIDWEYPDDQEAFLLMMKELYPALKAKGKGLSVAAAGEGVHGDGISTESFQYMDYLNIMAYDGPTPHSSFEYAERCLAYWTLKGCPKEKLILGLPFYGKDPNTDYKVLIQTNAAEASQIDEQDGIHYNGIPTMQKKVKLAQERAAGVMIWEVSQDVQNEYSLLKAINEAAKK
jgi:GH18 family chitinase